MVRYYITDPLAPAGGVLEWEVFPFNDTELSIEWVENTEYKFFRRELTEGVLLQKKGFGFWDKLIQMETFEPCRFLWLRIEKQCDGQWIEDWRGWFTTYNCEFDKDQCTVLINTFPYDDYDTVIKDIDTQYNVLEVATLTTEYRAGLAGTGTLLETYTTGRVLQNIALFFAGKWGLGYSSDFFVKGDPIAGRNLGFITFNPKEDVFNPLPSDFATERLQSFSEFMAIIHKMFDVYWYIDGNNIRIEHEQFFLNGLSYSGTPSIGLDLTLPEFELNKVNKYKYVNDEMPYREEWSYLEGRGSEWINGSIEYDTECTTSDIIKRDLSDVTIDINYIYNNSTDISKGGWCILHNTDRFPTGSGYYIQLSTAVPADETVANYYLSWQLLYDYWKYNRILIEGTVNLDTTTTTFQSATDKKEQIPITFPLCCNDFDPFKLYTTSMGNGRVKSAKKRNKDQQMELTLRYP